jgi:hypothetical protein
MDHRHETGPVGRPCNKGHFAFHLGNGSGMVNDNVISDKGNRFRGSLVPIRDGSWRPRLCESAVDIAILLLGCVVKSHDCNVRDFDKKAYYATTANLWKNETSEKDMSKKRGLWNVPAPSLKVLMLRFTIWEAVAS